MRGQDRNASIARLAVLEGEPVSLSRLESRFLAFSAPTASRSRSRTRSRLEGWEADRRREREAYARGDEFRRYTWMDVTEEPAALLRELFGLLSR